MQDANATATNFEYDIIISSLLVDVQSAAATSLTPAL